MQYPHIDHYIQLEIVKTLASRENGISFTELKDPSIENSHFNYHLRKLIDKGYVEKNQNDEYELTVTGVHFLSWTQDKMRPLPEPRHLINFVIVDGDRLLLRKRKNRQLQLLNQYMLPGDMSHYCESQESRVKDISKDLFNEELPVEYLFLFECIIKYSDGLNSHSLISLYRAQKVPSQLMESAKYDSVWVSVSEVMGDAQKFSRSPFIKDALTTMQLPEVPRFVSKTYELDRSAS